MNQTVAKIVIAVAVLLLTAGLIFLCAAARRPTSLVMAVALLLVGGGLVAWGGVTLRRLRDLDPENLSDRITQLARASGNGEVTLSQVVAELSVPDEAAVAALNLLERRGQCHRQYRGEREVYFFPGLKPTLVKRRCPYCGTEFSVKQALNKCPHCGGDLKLQRD